jgi:hypothetical protein
MLSQILNRSLILFIHSFSDKLMMLPISRSKNYIEEMYLSRKVKFLLENFSSWLNSRSISDDCIQWSTYTLFVWISAAYRAKFRDRDQEQRSDKAATILKIFPELKSIEELGEGVKWHLDYDHSRQLTVTSTRTTIETTRTLPAYFCVYRDCREWRPRPNCPN